MLRKLLITAAAAVALAAPATASAQTNRVLLMPGVTYERGVQFTTHGPVAVHVIDAPKPGGFWSLKPHLSNGAIVGRERLTQMQKSIASVATVAGVNGDLSGIDGRPDGILLRNNVLAHPPLRERSSIGIGADGRLRVERVQHFGTWRGTGQRRPLQLNREPGANAISLFTPEWGPVAPTVAGGVEVVLASVGPTYANAEPAGQVVEVVQGTGSRIPPDGAVLQGRGTQAQRLVEEAPLGATVTIRNLLSPPWSDVLDALGGGPALVRDGKPIFRAQEMFTTSQMARNARTAVGQTAAGRILLVAVDGRKPGYSVGMTNFELAQTMVRLGAVTAAGLDFGTSTTMAFEGELLNRPSDPGGERAVSEGLFLLYTGVYAAPPRVAVVSPNGDGVDDVQELSYKLVRPSTVTVRLVGPGTTRVLDSGQRAPGVYRFTWTGTTAEGAREVEGQWRLAVSAVDDQGQASSAERPFSLNRTLGSLAVPASVRITPRGGRIRAAFTLSRRARITATVETAGGAVIRTLVRARQFPAGSQAVTWNGRDARGVLAHGGRYAIRVVASNEVGRVEDSKPFTLRR